MSQQAANEFDAAKAIVDALKGLDKQQQERAIRFASESAGLQGLASRSTEIPASGSSATITPDKTLASTPNRQVDIRRFVESKSPKTDQQFAAVVGYFYQFEAPIDQRKTAISAADLNTAARLVGRKRPANAAYTLANAKNAGYFDPAGKGMVRINSVGENLVAITLPETASKGEPASAKSGKKKLKKKASQKPAAKHDK
jgi:hypothetical protein